MSEAQKLSLHKFDNSSLILDDVLMSVIIDHLSIENRDLVLQLKEIGLNRRESLNLKKLLISVLL